MTYVPDVGPSRTVNPQLLRDWAHACVEWFDALRIEINDLNVFPIPDSDTGSNMLHTMRAAAEAVDTLPATAGVRAVTRTLADAAVTSARGNSGIILAQILVGLAQAAEGQPPEDEADPTGGEVGDAGDALDGADFDGADVDGADVDGAGVSASAGWGFATLVEAGLRRGALAAVGAVSEPREGTMLTLIRVAADSAAAHRAETAGDMARAVADDCAEALERTTEQLPELTQAGVVDAGGRGFLAMLDAMVGVLTGAANRRRRYRGSHGDVTPDVECSGAGDMDFEVMYLLDGAAAERIAGLRDSLGELGDAVVIVGDSSAAQERFSVHVHTCTPGLAIEAGLAVGTLSDIRVTCFALDALRSQVNSAEPPPRRKRAVLAVVWGEGAAELFAEAGASVLRADDEAQVGAQLDADTLAKAIRDTDSAHVVIMANGALASQELVAVAAEVRSPQRSVVSLPTSSMAQCLAALAVHDPDESPDADAYAMAEAAAGTRWGTVRYADSRMMTLAGTCDVGDVLGLIGSDVLVIAADQTGAATALVDLLLATGGELVTVLAGSRVDQGALDAVSEQMRQSYPGIELAIYRTGQPDDLLQVGIE